MSENIHLVSTKRGRSLIKTDKNEDHNKNTSPANLSTENTSEGNDSDSDFKMENDVDDEDSIAPEEDVADEEEISGLMKESDMNLDELLATYGINAAESPVSTDSVSASTSGNGPVTRKRKSLKKRNLVDKPKKRKNQTVNEPDTAPSISDRDNVPSDSSDEQASNSPATGDNEYLALKSESDTELSGDESPVYNSADDEDYDPTNDYERSWKGESHSEIEKRFTEGCSLLWDPLKISESDVISYQRAYAVSNTTPLPSERTIDDEESNYDTREALNRLKLKTVMPSDISNYMSTWTEAECQAFEKGFALYNKDFRQIQETKLRHRAVNELVQFYYVWKKTARYDEFSKTNRKDKKKPLHPGLTDFMDCLAQEQDIIAESLMNAACSDGGRQQTSVLPDSEQSTLTSSLSSVTASSTSGAGNNLALTNNNNNSVVNASAICPPAVSSRPTA